LAYKIVYIPEALKQLSKLDKAVAKNIVEYMKGKAEDPTSSGKALRKERVIGDIGSVITG